MHLWPDISNVQGAAINGALAKQQGMAAISAKASQGTWFVDRFLAANYQQAKDNGMPFLAYHYPEQGAGQAQAQFFLQCVEKACGTLDGIALMLDREACDGATADAFIDETRILAPSNALDGYEAAWVVNLFGPSKRMAELPLIWSNYLTTTGSPQQIVAGVTPGWFEPFGGHSAYAARQYTDRATVGGFAAVDCNVCFDDAIFAQLFGLTSTPATPAPAGAPSPARKARRMQLFQEKDNPCVYVSDGMTYRYVASPFALSALQSYIAVLGLPNKVYQVAAGYRASGAAGVLQPGSADPHPVKVAGAA